MISLKQRDPEHGAVLTGRIARAIPGAPGGLQLLEVFSWVGKTGVRSKGGPDKMTPCKCAAIFFFNTNQLQCLQWFCVGLRQFEPLTAVGPLRAEHVSSVSPCRISRANHDCFAMETIVSEQSFQGQTNCVYT